MEFYVNKDAQSNGNHEVHEIGCTFMPDIDNSQYLGDFLSCRHAVIEAKKYYSNSNGCYYCAPACHTS